MSFKEFVIIADIVVWVCAVLICTLGGYHMTGIHAVIVANLAVAAFNIVGMFFTLSAPPEE